jgi:hypothetical protein
VARYFCASCNLFHDEMPTHLGPDAPHPWYQIPPEERASRAQLSPDQCVIDNRQFFVRGRIMLLVTDADEAFTWLAWVAVSKESFVHTSANWNVQGRENGPPSFGWLQSVLPYDPSTLNLQARVRTMKVGERAVIDLEESNHPLALEQRDGISSARLHVLVERSMNPGAGHAALSGAKH